jgi:protease I
MQSHLHGLKVAILVGNGFDEASYMEMQRVWKGSGVRMSLVSANPGLVNSWRGEDWGLNYPIDFHLASAFAADFDVLFVPGGRRGIDKLMTTAHTKRFINGFLNAGKPVAMYNEALELLAFAGCEGRQAASADEAMFTDGMLFTALAAEEILASAMQEGYAFVSSALSMKVAA